MQSLEYYLNQAPKTFLNKVHQSNLEQSGGLIQNSRLIQDITSWAIDDERIKAQISELSDLQKSIVRAIYSSGKRGITKSQILLFVPESERFLIKDTILNFSWHLICYTAKGESENEERIYGFKELRSFVFETLSYTVVTDTSRPAWLDYSMMISYHYISLAAQVQLSPWKLSQTGEPHRRNITSMESRFEFALNVDKSLASSELNFLIEFGKETKDLQYTDEGMVLNPDFKKSIETPGEIYLKLIDFWLHKVNWTQSHLIEVLMRAENPANINDILADWWVLAPDNLIPKLTQETHSIHWTDLPNALKEAWCLGLVQFSAKNNEITLGQMTPLARHVLQGGELDKMFVDQSAFSTPDFEVVVGVQQQSQHLFILECIAKATTDDRVMKYRLEKSRFIKALSSKINLQDVEDCLDWVKLPPTPRVSVNDWMNSFKEAKFSRPLLLEVSTKSTRETLKGITSFSQYIIKELPEFGFILQEAGEENAKYLLEQLGYHPSYDDEIFVGQNNFSTTTSRATQEEDTIQYPSREINLDNQIQMGELSQYGSSFKDLNPPQILRILRYCIICDFQLEIFWKTKTTQKAVIHPKEVDPETQEILRAQLEKTNEKIEIEIGTISNLKILENF